MQVIKTIGGRRVEFLASAPLVSARAQQAAGGARV